MDGIAATKKIRRLERKRLAGGKSKSSEKRSKKISIIAITAHALKGDRDQFIKAGMDDYVSKPISKIKLLQAMERCVKKQL